MTAKSYTAHDMLQHMHGILLLNMQQHNVHLAHACMHAKPHLQGHVESEWAHTLLKSVTCDGPNN